MDEEQSLLEQVRQKEGELKKKIDAIQNLTEKKILEAKKKASENIAAAGPESDKEIEGWSAIQKDKLQNEMDDLKKQNSDRKIKILARGEQNLPKAVDRIINLVSLEPYAAEND